ncbi:MAG: hypothetical protein HFG20_02555 [Anaerotruncus sp.]|nr:hypothetical protein [Anaerotruncus sp.]
MKKKIVFSHNMPLDGFEEYVKDFEIVRPAEPLAKFSREQAEQAMQDASVFICIADFVCDRALMERSDKLECVGNLGSGFNNVDVDYATSRGIYVLNTPTAVMEPTSEMTIALMLSVCRSTVRYDRDLRREKVCTPTLLFVRDMMLYGKTLGVIGFGRIGKSVARKAVGLGMKVIYNDLYRASEQEEQALNATFMQADEVIKNCDVLTLHMPYLPEYHHYMNDARFAMMKKTAYLINASRGPIVEEKALVKALKEGIIRGAALDVHEFEPNISEEIIALPNIVITPHCCTNIAEIRLNMLCELLEGVDALAHGRMANNVVNRSLCQK